MKKSTVPSLVNPMFLLFLGIQYNITELNKPDNIFFDKLFDPFIDALDEEAKQFQSMFEKSKSLLLLR